MSTKDAPKNESKNEIRISASDFDKYYFKLRTPDFQRFPDAETNPKALVGGSITACFQAANTSTFLNSDIVDEKGAYVGTLVELIPARVDGHFRLVELLCKVKDQ